MKETPLSERLRREASYAVHSRLLANPASRRRHRGERAELSPVQRRAAEDLSKNGIALVGLRELFGGDALWTELSDSMQAFVRKAESKATVDGKRRKKWDYLIRRKPPKLAPEDPWLRFGISDEVLGIVNAYRGLWTKLVEIEQWYTVPYPDADKRIASQRWHRDPRDRNMVKVFTYFSDVDEDSGPFEYIRGTPPGGPHGDFWPWKPFNEKYPPEKKLLRETPTSEHMTVTAPAGTIIFCDTTGFHRGGFARQKPRVMSYHQYVSPASLRAGLQADRRFSVLWQNGGGGLSQAARFALT
jgi:Phytanoyl-CoA dioxygenase (PhyH)